MLTLDRTLLTLVVPVLVFVAITGCASGADDTPSEDKSGGVFERLLAVVPDSPYTREGAYMNDYLRARDAFGIPLPGHDADEDDLLDYIIKLTVFDNDRGDGYMMADGPEFSGFSLFSQDKNAIRIENLRHLAFDIRHVEQSVTVGGGTRNQLELVKGSFDPDDSRQALDRCDRCPPPDRQEHMGVEFYSWGEGHLDNRWLPPAFDGLGRGGRIAVLDSFVLRTSETAGIKALIDVHVGNIPSLADDPDIMFAARQMDDLALYSGLVIGNVDTLSVGGLVSRCYALGQQDVLCDKIVDEAEETGTLDEYLVLGAGAGLDDDGPFMAFVFVYDDESESRDNVAVLEEMASHGTAIAVAGALASSPRAWSEVFKDVEVWTKDRALIAKLRGGGLRWDFIVLARLLWVLHGSVER